jgi:hypothetical protein
MNNVFLAKLEIAGTILAEEKAEDYTEEFGNDMDIVIDTLAKSTTLDDLVNIDIPKDPLNRIIGRGLTGIRRFGNSYSDLNLYNYPMLGDKDIPYLSLLSEDEIKELSTKTLDELTYSEYGDISFLGKHYFSGSDEFNRYFKKTIFDERLSDRNERVVKDHRAAIRNHQEQNGIVDVINVYEVSNFSSDLIIRDRALIDPTQFEYNQNDILDVIARGRDSLQEIYRYMDKLKAADISVILGFEVVSKHFVALHPIVYPISNNIHMEVIPKCLLGNTRIKPLLKISRTSGIGMVDEYPIGFDVVNGTLEALNVSLAVGTQVVRASISNSSKSSYGNLAKMVLQMPTSLSGVEEEDDVL